MTRADEQTRDRRRSMDDEILGRRIYVVMDPAYSPYRWGYNPYAYSYGPYGYSPLGYRGYGYGNGSSYYGYPGYLPPVIVVDPAQPAQKRGQMVRGRGYTEANPSTATPQAATSRAAERQQSSGSSSSGSSSSGSTSQPRSEPAPRTAQPKPR
jgi:hypothetical protein